MPFVKIWETDTIKEIKQKQQTQSVLLTVSTLFMVLTLLVSIGTYVASCGAFKPVAAHVTTTAKQFCAILAKENPTAMNWDGKVTVEEFCTMQENLEPIVDLLLEVMPDENDGGQIGSDGGVQ